ncbi:MAG TPA: DedA family protein [bacterium]|nr:DedA family protein [bacterium]
MPEVAKGLLDFILHLDQHLDAIIGTYGLWAYLILFLVIFCETGLVVTPFLPGDSLLLAAGTIAARGTLDVGILSLALVIAAVAGDAANYWIGRLAGTRILSARGRWYLREEHLDRTHAFYERHGAKTIILARFVPIIRTFAPFVAGLGRMTYARFTLYNVTGGIAWIVIFVLGGYYFGNLPAVRRNFSLVILGVILVSVLPIVIAVVRERSPGRDTSRNRRGWNGNR